MQGGAGDELQGESEKVWLSDSVKLTRVSEELQSELIKDIMSLERERKDLLESITPSHSHWKPKQIDGRDGREDKSKTWRGRKEELSENTASASLQQDDNKGRLANIFDLILEDMEDLGHRMLSMAHVIDKSGSSLPLYKANRLVNSTSRIKGISEEILSYHDGKGHGQKGEIQDFLDLSQDYNKYDNELALNLEQERKKEKKKEEKKKEEKQKEKQKENEKVDDASTMEFLQIIMDFRKRRFSNHRACWERVWGGSIGSCGGFVDATTLSSMQFTHYIPDTITQKYVFTGSTLQIYSIRIKQLSGNLKWPLKVSGVVAVRDTVDHNRNILFSRLPRNYQLLTEKDPSLSLTGPSRAIFAVHPVDFEVELEINEGAESIRLHKPYNDKGSTPLLFRGLNCIVELSMKWFGAPLQATIVGIRVAKGSWPFEHGCRVVCPEVDATQTPREVVILDYYGEVMSVGTDGYLHLTRNVVSVEHRTALRVTIEVYSESGTVAQRSHVNFTTQNCQTSKRTLSVGNSELEIVVAWSLVVKKKLDLLMDCPAVEHYAASP
ncbi:unnamed protein product [Alopecurus aequalis]